MTVISVYSPMHCRTCNQYGIVMHNGIISGFGNKKISDTAHFVTAVLSRLPQEPEIVKQVLLATGSKFLLIQKNKLYFIGQFQAFKGLQVSNTYFSLKDKSTKFNCWTYKDLYKV